MRPRASPCGLFDIFHRLSFRKVPLYHVAPPCFRFTDISYNVTAPLKRAIVVYLIAHITRAGAPPSSETKVNETVLGLVYALHAATGCNLDVEAINAILLLRLLSQSASTMRRRDVTANRRADAQSARTLWRHKRSRDGNVSCLASGKQSATSACLHVCVFDE